MSSFHSSPNSPLHFVDFFLLRISFVDPYWKTHCSAQKMKFLTRDFFSKCDHLHLHLQLHLLKKSLMENFSYCALTLFLYTVREHIVANTGLIKHVTIQLFLSKILLV